jgi:hypothetical protein
MRPFLARSKSLVYASNVYIEYQKQTSHGLTWYNPRTHRSFTPFPPKMLTLHKGKRTQCQTSVLPHLDKMFTLPCSQCITTLPGEDAMHSPRIPPNGSEIFCVQCEGKSKKKRTAVEQMKYPYIINTKIEKRKIEPC